VCEPGIKKSWSLSPENYFLIVVIFLPSRSLHHLSSSIELVFSFELRSPFCDWIRVINLYLGIKNLVAALTIFIFPPDYFLSKSILIPKYFIFISFLFYLFLFFNIFQTQENTRKFQPLTRFCFSWFWRGHIYIYTYRHMTSLF